MITRDMFFQKNYTSNVHVFIFLDMDCQQDEDTVNVVESEVSSPNSGTRTASPLSTSGGIITKRGPQVDQNDVPFELKLNVTETQFVVVENLASLDTNAVILKVLCLFLNKNV